MRSTEVPAIVTGGAWASVRPTAHKLAASGGRVTVFDRNEERGKEVVPPSAPGANFVGGDVTDPEDAQRAVDQAARGAT